MKTSCLKLDQQDAEHQTEKDDVSQMTDVVKLAASWSPHSIAKIA
jgi:hypothetical protein